MKTILSILLFIPILAIGQYRPPVRTNPNVTDGNGYSFRGHFGPGSAPEPPFDPNFDGNALAYYDYSDVDVPIGDDVLIWVNRIVGDTVLDTLVNGGTDSVIRQADGLLFKTAFMSATCPQVNGGFTIYFVGRVNVASWSYAWWHSGYDFATRTDIYSGATSYPDVYLKAGSPTWVTSKVNGNTVTSYIPKWLYYLYTCVFDNDSVFMYINGKYVGGGVSGTNIYIGSLLGAYANPAGREYGDLSIKRFVIRRGADNAEERAYINAGLMEDQLTDGDIWLLAGQSNANGQAAISGITNARYKAMDTVSFIWHTELGNRKFMLLNPGTNSETGSGKAGVETAFLYNMSEYKNQHISILKTAFDGSSIQNIVGYGDWNPSNNEYKDTLINRMISSVGNAELAFAKKRFKGIIWMQGEGDGEYEDYYTDMIALLDSITAHANSINLANGYNIDFLRVIVNTPAVHAADSTYCADQPNSFYISTTGCTTSDGQHWDANSLVTIGERIFEAVKNK